MHVFMNAGTHFVFRACMDPCMNAYFYTAAFIMEKSKGNRTEFDVP